MVIPDVRTVDAAITSGAWIPHLDAPRRGGTEDPPPPPRGTTPRPGPGGLRLIWAACGLCATLVAAADPAAGAAAGAHALARIVVGRAAGERAADGLLAGIAITLDPTYITYWRDPGEAGVAPRFDFSRSENLASARVEYPAPARFDEGGVEAFGYAGAVTFPVVAVAADPARPVVLDVALDYAVCAALCLPARAHLRAVLGTPAASDGVLLGAALATVPRRRRLGETGPVRIDAIAHSGARAFRVEAVAPDGTGSLFVEAPDGWYFAAKPAISGADGHLSFPVEAVQVPPADVPRDGTVVFTLVSAGGSIEVPVELGTLGIGR